MINEDTNFHKLRFAAGPPEMSLISALLEPLWWLGIVTAEVQCRGLLFACLRLSVGRCNMQPLPPGAVIHFTPPFFGLRYWFNMPLERDVSCRSIDR